MTLLGLQGQLCVVSIKCVDIIRLQSWAKLIKATILYEFCPKGVKVVKAICDDQ